MLLVCCVFGTNMLLSNIPEWFFFVRTYLKICYLSAVYKLPTHCFKFLWGRCWWGVFCTRHNLNMLLVWCLLFMIDCLPMHIGLISEEDVVKIMDEKLKGKKYEEVLKLSVDEVDA